MNSIFLKKREGVEERIVSTSGSMIVEKDYVNLQIKTPSNNGWMFFKKEIIAAIDIDGETVWENPDKK